MMAVEIINPRIVVIVFKLHFVLQNDAQQIPRLDEYSFFNLSGVYHHNRNLSASSPASASVLLFSLLVFFFRLPTQSANVSQKTVEDTKSLWAEEVIWTYPSRVGRVRHLSGFHILLDFFVGVTVGRPPASSRNSNFSIWSHYTHNFFLSW